MVLFLSLSARQETFVKLVNRVLPITDEYNSGENAVIREETANSLR